MKKGIYKGVLYKPYIIMLLSIHLSTVIINLSEFFISISADESVFGCSLDKLCANERVDVPLFVQECILAIESKTENLKTDGIYRASGNLSQGIVVP